jgi:gas vesicle protein
MEELPMNERHEQMHPNGLVVGFLCGAAVGAGIALLTAPSSGAVTRKRIGVTARKVANTTRQGFDRMRGRLGELRQDFKDSVAHGADEMSNASPR